MRYLPAFLAVLLLCLAAGVSPAAEPEFLKDLEKLQRLRDNVEVDAEQLDYDAQTRRLMAKGNVRLAFEQAVITADELTADLEARTISARGNVVLGDGANRLEGDEIEYDLRTNLGVVRQGRGLLSPGISLVGAEIRREGERRFRLIDGSITSCRICQTELQVPDWELRTAEATVHLDDYIIADHSSFWVKGLPAFYVPRLIVPVSRRRTGFLIPRAGMGGRDGFMLAAPFFWAISPSQDLTVTPTYRTKRGPDLLGEYRYVLSEDSGGAMTGRYLYDTVDERSRSEFRWRHDQAVTPSLRFKADVNYLSDDSLARDFVDSSVAERTQRTLTSNISLEQTTSQYLLLGRIAADDDLSTSETSRSSYLPEGRFQWLPTAYAGGRLVAEGDLSAGYLERNRSVDFGRLDLTPALHLPLDLAPGLTATTSLGLRETAYTDSPLPQGERNRLLLDARERLAMRLMRRFSLAQGGLQSLTHAVEPSLTYHYLPWVDQTSYPQFDSVDFVSPQHRLTLRLGNRLMARSRKAEGDGEVFEFAGLQLAQSFNLQPRTREFSDVYLASLTPERVDQAVKDVHPLGNGFSQVRERAWSNTVISGQINPHPMVGFRGTVAVNAEEARTDGASASAELRWPDLLRVGIDQTFVRGQQASGFVARAELSATKTIRLDYLTRYEAVTGTFMEHGIGLHYNSCCWQVTVRYTYRSELATRAAENDIKFSVDIMIPTPTGLRSIEERPAASR